MTSPYSEAMKLGFSDENLNEHFTKIDPEFPQKFQKAKELGYSPEEIYSQAHSSYRANKDINKSETDEDDFIKKEVPRHTTRLASRGLEQVLGLPGNLREGAKSLSKYYQENKPKSVFGVKFPEEPESIKKFEEFFPIGETISNLLNYLPTSSQVKKFSEEKTKGYTSPKSETERIGDEVFENLVASAIPGQGQRNIWRNIAAPIAGVLGKEATKYIGGSDKSQVLTQLGLNIVIPLMSGNAPQLNRQTWQNVRANVPNVNINSNNLLVRARDLQQRIARGLGSRSETHANTTLNRLIEKLERGTISADELMASNISLNEIVGDPELFGRGGHLFEEIRGLIRDGMEEVGQHAPEWYREWQRANEIHGAIANSNYIANIIRTHSEPLVSEGARALFHAAVHGTAKAAATIPPIYLIYKGTQVFNRMANSPELLRYYTNVLTNSLRGNVAAMSSNLEKLDQALLKEEKKPKPPFKNASQKK